MRRHLILVVRCMPRDLNKLLSLVDDEESYVAFIAALGNDYAEERDIERTHPPVPYIAGALGWQHGSIDAFLEAASAWGESTFDNPKLNPQGINPWQRCARILYAGKYYE